MSDLEDIVKECKIESVVSYEKDELEEIIDDALEEIEVNERLEAQSKRYDQVLESAKQNKPFDKIKDELSVMSKLNSVHDSILVNRDISMKSESNILAVAALNNKGINTIDNKFNKVVYALFIVFFLLGVLIGVIDEVWKPYISDILNFTRASSNVIKG